MQIVLSSLGDIQDFYSIPIELLDDESKKLYQFCEKFKADYGKLPTVEILQKEGYEFTKPIEKFSYYLKQLEKQSIFAERGNLINALSEALSNDDEEMLFKIIEEFYNKMLKISIAVDPDIYAAGSRNYFRDIEKEVLSPIGDNQLN
jgi:hypothetical protein